jgi:hypothetical protein
MDGRSFRGHQQRHAASVTPKSRSAADFLTAPLQPLDNVQNLSHFQD